MKLGPQSLNVKAAFNQERALISRVIIQLQTSRGFCFHLYLEDCSSEVGSVSCCQSSISTVEDLSLRVKSDLAKGQLDREQGGGRGHAQVRRFRRMERRSLGRLSQLPYILCHHKFNHKYLFFKPSMKSRYIRRFSEKRCSNYNDWNWDL